MALTATAGSDSKRTIIIVIVALLHVGMYYVIESGLSHQIISMLAPPIDTVMIDEDKPPEELPPPPPPPEIAEPPPFIPPPEVTVQVQTESKAIQVVTNERPPVVAPPPVAPPAAVEAPFVKAGQDPKRPIRPTDEFYPPASIRAEEEGVVMVEIYIAADGRVTDSRIKGSSGFQRLDDATLKYVKTWRMKPATRGGVPEGSWVTVPVRWKLAK